MFTKVRLFFALLIVILIVTGCNIPTAPSGDATPDIPGPNKTLTALFAITPEVQTATATLPPVVTATSSGSQGGNDGGGQGPTATTAPTSGSSGGTTQATATKAPVKTSTPLPKATATVPSARTRVQVVANYLSTAPTLDGDWGEWKDVTKEYPANTPIFGGKNYTDENDVGGSFHVGWDNTYLYLAVKVHDDKYVQNASGEDIYKGDSIEILLDTNLKGDYYYNQLSPDDFQLGFSPGKGGLDGTKEAYLWFPSSIAGTKSNVKIASRAETGGYRVEIAIPWSVFELSGPPANGTHMGFVVSISDNDDPSQNVQQTMISNDPDRKLLDPTTWGDIQFVK